MKTSKLLLGLAMATAQLPLAQALYAQSAELDRIAEEYWVYQLEQSPEFASSLGIADPEGDVTDYSLEAEDRRVEQARVWLKELDALNQSDFDQDDFTNFGILHRDLSERIEGNTFGQRVINFTNRGGWHQNMAEMQNGMAFRTPQDFRTYIERLKKYPQINAQNIAVANQAIAGGYMQPCDAMGGYDSTISGLITDDPRASRFFEVFTKPRPAGVSEAEFKALGDEAARVIAASVMPELKKHLEWYTTQYAPKCAKAPGVSAQPGGADYYDYRIRVMTTTDLSAKQIHEIGMGEVKRIAAAMDALAKEQGYDSRQAYGEYLRSDPKYFAKTPEELMRYTAFINKTIDGKMPSLFGRVARLPYGIKEIPAEIAEGTTTAYYFPGSPDAGIAGFYYVNTSLLDQRPFWEVPVLSVHEAVPGHHQQIALQQELDIPEFRRNGAFYTGFVEGWGLYSESLGEEMGLYDTPEKKMGQYSYDMWRACRLVVDTGIHSMGWSKQQAIDFMRENTALSDANIEAEVNRYIAWPAQALAYKLGQLKIKELREMATTELGDSFDLRAFHDVVLGQGAVPLDVLEAQVKRWVDEQKKG
jgi:uncharacterized protein (DUF885 family)